MVYAGVGAPGGMGVGVGFEQSPYAGLNHHMVPHPQHHGGVMQPYDQQQVRIASAFYTFYSWSHYPTELK